MNLFSKVFSPSCLGQVRVSVLLVLGPSLFLAMPEARAESAFERAQASERQALDHRLRTEAEEWSVLQKGLLAEKEKEWSQRKQQIFQSVQGGTERRMRVNQLEAERRDWLKQQSVEKDLLRAEQARVRAALDAQQRSEAEAYREAVRKGQTPPIWLWPESRSEKQKAEQAARDQQPSPTPSLGPIQKP